MFFFFLNLKEREKKKAALKFNTTSISLALSEHNFAFRAEGVQPISWTMRMNIAIDVARGLSFLHSLDPNVIYRDLKASNILLDSVRTGTLISSVI